MVFDFDAALRGMGNDKSLLRETLQDFIDFYGEAGKKLRTALDEQRYADVEILAHTLKGLGGTFAAPVLRDAALALEQAIHAGAFDGADQKAAALEQAVSDMVADIQTFLRG